MTTLCQILVGATLAVVPHIASAGETLTELLRRMPEEVCGQLLLTRTNLLDLIDTYEAHATTPIRNRLGELVNIDTLDNQHCQLHVAPSTTAVFTLAPRLELVEMQLTTTLGETTITMTRLYNIEWKEKE